MSQMQLPAGASVSRGGWRWTQAAEMATDPQWSCHVQTRSPLDQLQARIQ
jgi:hypothetical protein